MANAYILELENMPREARGHHIPVANLPGLTTQKVTFSTTAQSQPFNLKTRYIRVVCDAKAHFRVGDNPVATADAPYMAADVTEHFAVRGGHRMAFYDGSS